MSAIEVLKELQKNYVNCIDGVHIFSPEYEAIDEALLALEKKEDDVRRGRVEELERLKDLAERCVDDIDSIDNMSVGAAATYFGIIILIEGRLKELWKGELK